MWNFEDRVDAGRQLARELTRRARDDSVVLGLPRGGVPVAAEVARALSAPLDVLVVRKVGAPGHEEVAMGAVGEDGAVVRNPDVIAAVGADEETLAAAEEHERAVVERRAGMLRAGRPAERLAGRAAIIVDDGIATGATVRTACRVARARGAARVVVAVPVAAPSALAGLDECDEVVCLCAPPGFVAVGMHYIDFRQTSEDEVVRLLAGLR
ncbi:phosphoribosyltransferase [Microbacterium sp. NPDC058342]|uniref:phosphoribosyltransferase n=1 Tax=Microbacterium sp. NPDC058342 TaxID=3346454 RepID=UPI003663BFC6